MIYNIIETVASDNGSKFKIAELEKHTENELLKKVLQATYCPVTQFYIRQIPEYTPQPEESKGLDWALNELQRLSTREFTGHGASQHLQSILNSLTQDECSIVEKIIGKDLKAGVSSTTINKVFGKNFIKETPYMGAVSFNHSKVDKLFKEHHAVYSEEKMDGRYTNIKITSDSVFMESRQGKETFFGDTFNNLREILSAFKEDTVLNAELIIEGMDRYTSNGAIASIVSIGNKIMEGKDVTKEKVKFLKEYGEEYEELRGRIVAVAWDYIPLELYEKEAKYESPRDLRLKKVKEYVEYFKLPNLKFVPVRKVENKSEALAHFKEIVDAGGEGTILKGASGTWKDGKPNWQIKFKIEFESDLQIIGFNYGTKGTKNENVISSLTVHTKEGKLITRPGGIKEKDMQYITDNKDSLLNTIVTVKCSGLSQDKEGNYALLHPVFKCLRDDKIEADTLEQVKEAEEMVKSL